MSHDENTELNLLLAYADEHSPVLDSGLPHDSAGDEGDADEGEVSGGLSFYDLGAAGNDVAAQGWSVIAPEGKHGDGLIARIQPLIDARADLGGPLRIYRVPPRMTLQEAQRWRQDVYNNDDPDLIPRYQLFLGDLHEVPLELQHVQAPEGFVGRLAFADPEGYEAYVDKVLRWERSRAAARREPDALFYSVHDGTAATRIGHRGLIEPVVEMAEGMRAAGRFKAGSIRSSGDPEDPSPDELMREAAGLDAGVLFTMSHGAGAPRRGWTSPQAQLDGQGAMSFGREGALSGADIRGKAFARGGVWFMFACFGAGTPTRSKFHHWLARLAKHRQFRGRPESVLKSLPTGEQRPFIGALPQAALASADGPLAFIGHLDLAWTYSFSEIDSGRQKGRPGKYYNVLKSLCRGDRVGVALQELERFHNDKNQELTDLYDLAEEARANGRPDVIDRARIGHLWMVRQDLSGYILLGDPAVQLPLDREDPGGSPVPPPMVESIRSEQVDAGDDEGPSSFEAGGDSSDDESRGGADSTGEPRDASGDGVAARPTEASVEQVRAPQVVAREREAPPEVPEREDSPANSDGMARSTEQALAKGVAGDESPGGEEVAQACVGATEPASGPMAPRRPSGARPSKGEIEGEIVVGDGEEGASALRWRIRWRLD